MRFCHATRLEYLEYLNSLILLHSQNVLQRKTIDDFKITVTCS